MENPPFSFDPWSFLQDDLMSSPEIFETNPKTLDELQELYKPFYPELNPYYTQTIITRSLPVAQDVDKPENKKSQQSVSQSNISSTNEDSAKPKSSCRKNQKNRVVRHVTADALQSDIWAWRKYGQKPIKSSLYPRSYYRCSSSKECLARKQVERSCSDPRIFIISYTAEHSHGYPTRRNSLSGSNRIESSTMAISIAKSKEPHEVEETVLSPKTIKVEPVQLQRQDSVKMVDLQVLEDGDQWNKILTPDVMLSDELVQSLEKFEGLFLVQFPDLSHELWSINHMNRQP